MTKKRHSDDPARGTWIDHLPPPFRTRRGFAALLGGVAFIGFSAYYLTRGHGPLSIVEGLASGITLFLFCWFVFGAMTGFDP